MTVFALQRSKLGDLDSPPYNLGRKEDATNLYTYLGSTSIELGKPRSSGRNVTVRGQKKKLLVVKAVI